MLTEKESNPQEPQVFVVLEHALLCTFNFGSGHVVVDKNGGILCRPTGLLAFACDQTTSVQLSTLTGT
jgi:hypothetical protein